MQTYLILMVIPALVAAQIAPAGELIADASKLQNAGKFAESAARWQQFVSTYPNDASIGIAYQGLGACLLQTGDWAGATQALKQALQRLPEGESGAGVRWNLAISLYRRAEHTKKSEDLREVAQALKSLLADDKTPKERHSLAKFYLARTERALGNNAVARKHLDELLQSTRDDALIASVLLALASVAEAEQDWPAVITCYRDFLKKYADHAAADEARSGLADAYLQNEQNKEAEAQFGDLVKRKGLVGADYALFRWCELAELRDDPKVAAERWQTFIAKHEKSAYRARALRRAGLVQMQLADYELAASHFTQWLKENPQHADYSFMQVQLGLAHAGADNHAEAEKALHSALPALKTDDLRAQAILGLARCAAKLGRPAEGVERFVELFASKSALENAPALHCEAVLTALAASNTKQALTWTDGLASSAPKDSSTAFAQLQLARHLTQNGELEPAFERCKWVIKSEVMELKPAGLYLAGFCAFKLRKFNEAITYFEDLRDRHPTSAHTPAAVYSLGAAWEALGANAKAIAAYEHLIKNFSADPLAQQARRRVQALQG